MNYDIHTYWRNDAERNIALELKQLLTQNQVQTFSLVDIPIGPHPLPMFEAHVSAQRLPEIEVLLVANKIDNVDDINLYDPDIKFKSCYNSIELLNIFNK